MTTKRTLGTLGMAMAIGQMGVWALKAHELKIPWGDLITISCAPILIVFGLKLFADRNDKK